MLNDLKKLGVKEGGYLLVHSSYKSLGTGVANIAEAISNLQKAVGAEGTLLFPALSYETVNAESPFFDIANTPSCVGAIPEWFRKQPGVLRSMGATHSVTALGANAAEMVANQENDNTPVGENSPFRKLRDKGGQILMLGCGLNPNTSMHGVEELTNPPYLFKEQSITYTCKNWDGSTKEISVRRHNFGGDAHQRYDRLRYVLPEDTLKRGMVLDAECYLIEAKPMWDIAEKILREDPLFFIDGGQYTC